MRMKLTKRAVESLGVGQADILVWDDTLRGFGVKITPKGARVYLLQYSFGGRSRRVTIGRHGDLTVEQSHPPGYGPAAVSAITRADVVRLHQGMKARSGGSNIRDHCRRVRRKP